MGLILTNKVKAQRKLGLANDDIASTFFNQINPFNMNGSLNNQVAAGFAAAMGDPQLAGNLSGYGQLSEQCVGDGAKKAYLNSLKVSAWAIAYPGAGVLARGAVGLFRLSTVSTSSAITLQHQAAGFAWTYPKLAQWAPYAVPSAGAVAQGFSQLYPRMPGSSADLIFGMSGDKLFDTLVGP